MVKTKKQETRASTLVRAVSLIYFLPPLLPLFRVVVPLPGPAASRRRSPEVLAFTARSGTTNGRRLRRDDPLAAFLPVLLDLARALRDRTHHARHASSARRVLASRSVWNLIKGWPRRSRCSGHTLARFLAKSVQCRGYLRVGHWQEVERILYVLHFTVFLRGTFRCAPSRPLPSGNDKSTSARDCEACRCAVLFEPNFQSAI